MNKLLKSKKKCPFNPFSVIVRFVELKKVVKPSDFLIVKNLCKKSHSDVLCKINVAYEYLML